MRAFAKFIAVLGFIILIGAGMMAFDDFMTDDRRAAVNDEINSQLDAGSERYEERREEGCRRNCGFFGTVSNMIVSMRDGMFLSLPFEPAAVMPPAPEGWTARPYDLAVLEGIVGRTLWQTAVVDDTENEVLKDFERINNATKTGFVQIYRSGDKAIVFGVMMIPNGLRAAKDGENRTARVVPMPFATIDGVPVRRLEQRGTRAIPFEEYDVAYHRFAMDLDGQATISVLASASTELEDITVFLSDFAVAPLVRDMPAIPDTYVAGAGFVVPEPPVEDDDDGEESEAEP